MSAGDATIVRGSKSRSDDAFQRLLLKFSSAAAEGLSSQSLIRLFCQAGREFFQVDGAYFWQCISGDEVVGAEADGLLADRFRGTRVKAGESAVAIAIQAIRQRKTVYENRLNPAAYRITTEFQALSLMAAPLIVGNE